MHCIHSVYDIITFVTMIDYWIGLWTKTYKRDLLFSVNSSVSFSLLIVKERSLPTKKLSHSFKLMLVNVCILPKNWNINLYPQPEKWPCLAQCFSPNKSYNLPIMRKMYWYIVVCILFILYGPFQQLCNCVTHFWSGPSVVNLHFW